MGLLKTPAAVWRAYNNHDYTIRILNKQYKIMVTYYSNKSGFVHFAELVDMYKGDIISNAKIQYINRTWESYTGQSASRSAVIRAHAMGAINDIVKSELLDLL